MILNIYVSSMAQAIAIQEIKEDFKETLGCYIPANAYSVIEEKELPVEFYEKIIELMEKSIVFFKDKERTEKNLDLFFEEFFNLVEIIEDVSPDKIFEASFRFYNLFNSMLEEGIIAENNFQDEIKTYLEDSVHDIDILSNWLLTSKYMQEILSVLKRELTRKKTKMIHKHRGIPYHKRFPYVLQDFFSEYGSFFSKLFFIKMRFFEQILALEKGESITDSLLELTNELYGFIEFASNRGLVLTSNIKFGEFSELSIEDQLVFNVF